MNEPADGSRRPMLLSRRWMQVSLLVFILGFFGLGLAGYLNYKDEPPMPAKVVDPSGQTIFTKADVIAGQKVFLANGLMEYGSIFGHGAYLGPTTRPTTCTARSAPCAPGRPARTGRRAPPTRTPPACRRRARRRRRERQDHGGDHR